MWLRRTETVPVRGGLVEMRFKLPELPEHLTSDAVSHANEELGCIEMNILMFKLSFLFLVITSKLK